MKQDASTIVIDYQILILHTISLNFGVKVDKYEKKVTGMVLQYAY